MNIYHHISMCCSSVIQWISGSFMFLCVSYKAYKGMLGNRSSQHELAGVFLNQCWGYPCLGGDRVFLSWSLDFRHWNTTNLICEALLYIPNYVLVHIVGTHHIILCKLKTWQTQTEKHEKHEKHVEKHERNWYPSGLDSDNT